MIEPRPQENCKVLLWQETLQALSERRWREIGISGSSANGTAERACYFGERHGGACLLLWRTARRSVPATLADGTAERACYFGGRHGGACLLLWRTARRSVP
ncbi:MAG: hypothetical protein GXX96_22395, partial [Planctomycetaceae bacterium]|nr:hypothetical protein [Planctomycetaceae bacterium]